ncbi:hypothetical protein CTI12_AA335240 [Artemisia annua]|uniref:BZIP domain-containing protein n=1 Tax=Artemisia annua TaxID=35608 RepID=A0A2U1MW83_ARTAN|nr:hypothetical protein CTI12_AA335240 [Artemisia annua]
MFQPPLEMENGHNVIDMSNMNNLQMIPFDENDPEVIARRIKNRERQRRYRARKRQQADMDRGYMITQPVQLQVSEIQINETQMNDTPVDFVSRVYSQRNWKRDARRAHLLKQQIASENQSNVPEETGEHSSTPGGRNWKAEARSKRT